MIAGPAQMPSAREVSRRPAMGERAMNRIWTSSWRTSSMESPGCRHHFGGERGLKLLCASCSAEQVLHPSDSDRELVYASSLDGVKTLFHPHLSQGIAQGRSELTVLRVWIRSSDKKIKSVRRTLQQHDRCSPVVVERAAFEGLRFERNKDRLAMRNPADGCESSPVVYVWVTSKQHSNAFKSRSRR